MRVGFMHEQVLPSEGFEPNEACDDYPVATVMVPVIHGWYVQEYRYIPGWVKVKLKVAPGGSGPESNRPLLSVTVWVAVSLFSQVTVVPTATVLLTGE